MIEHHLFEEALPGFALGCLEGDEADRVAAHLAACKSCRRLLRDYEQTVELLAIGVPPVEPPDSLKDRLMHRIEKRPSIRPTSRPRRTRPFSSFFQWFSSPALAMASLVVIISLFSVNVMQWRQSREINNQLSAPLQIFKMRGTKLAPHADGTFVIGQNSLHGVLVSSDLPAISSTQQFQLWLIRNEKKDSGGTFTTTPLGYGVMKVSAPRPLPYYQSASVTIEPSGGSQTPTGPEMMSGHF